MRCYKTFLVPDKAQKAYLMVKLTVPELVDTKGLKQSLFFVIDRSRSRGVFRTAWFSSLEYFNDPGRKLKKNVERLIVVCGSEND